MKKSELDKAVYAAIESGLSRRPDIRKAVGVPMDDIDGSIRRLRFSGRVRLDRLAVNRVVALAAPAEGDPVEVLAKAEPQKLTGKGATMAIVDELEPVSPAVPLKDVVRAEAERASARRKVARSTGSVNRPLDAGGPVVLTPAETLVEAIIDSPREAYRMLERRWPDILRRVILDARRAEVSPVQRLVDLLDAGAGR